MCNINLIFKKNKKECETLSNVMNVLSYNSFKTNSDGEGFIGLNDNGFTIGKSVKKIRFNDNFWFLSSHQRFSTSGKNDTNNTHPHETKNLIIQHNGIFSELGNKEKSDTKEFVDLLEEEYVKQKHNIVRTIQAITKKVGGSYSIVLYEKKSKCVFYFKCFSTMMYHLQNKDWLIMSTNKDNVEYAKWYLKLNGTIKETKDGIIFDVLNGLQAKGTFNEKETSYSIIECDSKKNDVREKFYPKGYSNMSGYDCFDYSSRCTDYGSDNYFKQHEKLCDDYMKAQKTINKSLTDIEDLSVADRDKIKRMMKKQKEDEAFNKKWKIQKPKTEVDIILDESWEKERKLFEKTLEPKEDYVTIDDGIEKHNYMFDDYC